MATTSITTDSEAKIWVLACNEFEQCEIEVLKNNISFIESQDQPPTDPKETDSMYFMQNEPRSFQGNGTSRLWVFIDNKDIVRKRPYTPIRLHDALGNPLSSYYDAATGKYVLNIHNSDVHNVVINKYAYQETLTTTTLTSQTANDGSQYTIQVANSTGFIVGDKIKINTSSIETTLPTIIAVPVVPGPGIITLDRRLDKQHNIGDTVTKVITNMTLLPGTLAAPQKYTIGPEPGEVWHITRLLFSITHNTAGDLGKFGDLAKLTNGVILRSKINGQYGSFTNWKTAADIKDDMYDVDFDQRAGGQGIYGTTGRGTFTNAGAIVRLDGDMGDLIEVYIQDVLTTLLSFTIKFQGHLEAG